MQFFLWAVEMTLRLEISCRDSHDFHKPPPPLFYFKPDFLKEKRGADKPILDKLLKIRELKEKPMAIEILNTLS